MARKVVHDGRGTLQIRFPYDPRLVDLVKSLPNRRWNPAEKFWSVTEDQVLTVVDQLLPQGFRFDEATARLYKAVGGSADLGGNPGPVADGQLSFFDAAPMTGAAPAENAGSADDYTVSQLNEEVRAVLERAFPAPVWIVGEISGFNKNAHRKHVGFQLVERDENGRSVAEVNVTLFERTRKEIERKLASAGDPFALEDEITVRLKARVELHVAWGSYRAIAEELDIGFTLGEAARRREEILRQLGEEGLLEKNSALPFPDLPLRVGLITSLGSDAYNDVVRTFQESGWAFAITAHGARVQGRSTEPSVLNALDAFRECAADLDVVLVCRGGGSRTDLAWFDSLALGRAVASFPLPVIVGIGHEQDHSVLDGVGRRAKTPTAAAQMICDRVAETAGRVEERGRAVLEGALERIVDERRRAAERGARLARAARGRLEIARRDLTHRRHQVPRAALIRVAQQRTVLVQALRQLVHGVRRDLDEARRATTYRRTALAPTAARRLETERERSEGRRKRLYLIDPQRVIERGYAVLHGEDGKVVRRVAQAAAGAAMDARLADGAVRVRSEGPIEKG